MLREKEGSLSVATRDKRKAELLAPAGSFESLKGAVHAGADAVYMGGALFSARAYADNPDDKGLIDSVNYCHFYGRKLYLAVNTLLKQEEIDTQLYDYLSVAYDAGIDGVIVQDAGVMSFVNDRFPGLPIHISTQASVMTAGGAEYLKSRFPAVTRVVPARELSFEELKRFRAETDLEMEVFVHGALCVCYSGMCLMSSYIGDRSGNRGRCAQPCRKEYEGRIGGGAYSEESGHGKNNRSTGHETGYSKFIGNKPYLLSPKDQCLLDDIPGLIGIGIDSFKIEGRMKSPEYTAGTVAVYRHRIDEIYGKNEIYSLNDEYSDKQILAELYNRGGFNKGYLDQHNGQDMMSLLRPNHSGVEVGTVENVKGREASIRLTSEVFGRDVLEIRRGEKKIFEFTTAEGFSAGKTVKTLTMKDSRASVGDKVFRTRCGSLLERIRKDYIETAPKLPVIITFTAHKGEPSILELSCPGSEEGIHLSVSISIKGKAAEKAERSPITPESIKKQLGKLGDTVFEAAETEIYIDDDIFIPVSQLNEMRRNACALLEKTIIETNKPVRDAVCGDITPDLGTGIITGRTEYKEYNTEVKTDLKLESDYIDGKIENKGRNREDRITVSCTDPNQLAVAVNFGIRDICYNISDFDFTKIEKVVETIKESNNAILEFNEPAHRTNLTIGLPYTGRYDICDRLKDFIGKIESKYSGIRYMVRNYDELALFKKEFPGIMAESRFETDYMPYTMNSYAVFDACRQTLSTEADFNELKELVGAIKSKNKSKNNSKNNGIGTALSIYGYQPSMITAQCIYKNITGKCGKGTFPDGSVSIISQGREFRTRQLCSFCTNIIYNSDCLNNIDMVDELIAAGIDRLRIDLTFESATESESILKAVLRGRALPASAGIKTEKKNNPDHSELPPGPDSAGIRYTRGHMSRRVL